MTQKMLIASLFEFALTALGWILIWRLRYSSASRARRSEPLLPHWQVSSAGFGIASLSVFLAWVLAQIAARALASAFPVLKTDATLMTVFGGSLAQLCLIAGVAVAAYFIARTEPSASSKSPQASHRKSSLFLAGLVTCIITISVVYPSELIWERVLTWLKLPTGKQEMVEIFFRTASPARLVGLTAMAVVLAPVAEELVFRAGLFHYLRGRVPRWAALLVPALLFAALHVEASTLQGLITVAPLTCLGIVFSLAYEQTGRISVSILAHALFNLHTVAFILLGIDA